MYDKNPKLVLNLHPLQTLLDLTGRHCTSNHQHLMVLNVHLSSSVHFTIDTCYMVHRDNNNHSLKYFIFTKEFEIDFKEKWHLKQPCTVTLYNSAQAL